MRTIPTGNPSSSPIRYFDEEHEKLRQKYLDHKEQMRENARKSYQKKKAEYKNALFDKLGRQCIKCGFDDIRALQFDHINGGGTKERRKSRNHTYYRTMLQDPELENNIQILCANCNWIKLVEENEWLPKA